MNQNHLLCSKCACKRFRINPFNPKLCVCGHFKGLHAAKEEDEEEKFEDMVASAAKTARTARGPITARIDISKEAQEAADQNEDESMIYIPKEEEEKKRMGIHAKMLARNNFDPKLAKVLPEYNVSERLEMGSSSRMIYERMLNQYPHDFMTTDGELQTTRHVSRAGDHYAQATISDPSTKLPQRIFDDSPLPRDTTIAFMRGEAKPLAYSGKPNSKSIERIMPIPNPMIIDYKEFPGVVSQSYGNENHFTYEGKWLKGLMHGIGKYTFADGGVYEGEWSDGMRHGKGVASYPNGVTYEGEWKDDYMDGKGKMDFGKGITYIGEWKEGMQDGVGIQTFSNGEKYEGQFKVGKKHGRGLITSCTGYSLKGTFQDGFINGIGTLYTHDQRKIVRMWPKSTFRELVEHLWEEEDYERKQHQLELDELLAPLKFLMLEERIDKVRQDAEDERERERAEEAEARKQLLLEKREQIKLARFEAMQAANEIMDDDDY